ncbi:MAG: glycosyltransferase family 39 protein [Deltaproteobacteria bacterium]|nr:glycosyltransferase family 39 protein [Deltaproteobacteria bacterium]
MKGEGCSKKGFLAGTLAALLLVIFFGAASSVALKKNNTWDESAHILSGYAYIKKGMDWLSPLNHPVLGRAISGALPAALLDLDFDESVIPEGAPNSNFFPYSLKFLYENTVDGGKILFLSRLGNIVLASLLGIFVFVWSRELWGNKGAALSVFLYALCPNIIANASIATTDLPITAFFFISLYFIYSLDAKGLKLWRIVATGVAMALALASKHTALLLAPVTFVSFSIALRREGKKALPYYAILVFTVYLSLWAVYGFRFHSGSPNYEPLNWGVFSSSSLMPVFDLLRAWRLLPEAYLYSVAGVVMGASTGRAAFLMGEYSNTGWWYYFIVAFLIKTPIPVLILLVASALYLFAGRERLKYGLWLLLPALFVFTAMSLQKVNIGIRHILPVYPFIFTLIGFVPLIRTRSARVAKTVFAFLIAWYAYSAASIYPHQLAYFNEFIGGPKNGYKYLVDSNLDWGQDLKGLKKYMDENHIDKIKLAYFGLSDPKYFGIDYEYLPSYAILEPVNVKDRVEPKGFFAVSATMLQGVYLADRDYYKVFKSLEPVGNVGYSIFIYNLGAGPKYFGNRENTGK